MQFLDLAGLRELWSKIKAGDAAAKTTIEGESTHATNAYISAVGSVVSGEGQDGHTNYVITLHNAASNADVQAAKEALYGGQIPAENAETLMSLDSRIDNLESNSVVTVEKLGTATEGYAASYIVKQNNTQVGDTINIPRDFLVRSAELKVAAAGDNIPGVATGEKYIDFVINTPDDDVTAQHVYLPINDLVDTYTGSNGVAVDSNNNITAVVDSAANGNEFLSVSATGLKVSGVSAAINAAKSELKGASTDASSAETIAGAKKYADEAVANAAGNYATTAQGNKADSALQSVSASGSGFVSASASEKANNAQAISVSLTTASVETSGTTDGLAVASDVKSYVDGAVSNKNVSASGEEGANALVEASASNNAVTVNSTTKLQNAVASAESALQGVQVNSADLTVDANHKVNISIAEGSTDGTVAVNGSDVAVHGLGSMAYEDKTDYATSAQGGKADSALQSVSHGTDSNYVTLTVGAKDNNQDQALSASATIQPLASADASHMGLAEASDAKAYVDNKIAALDADLDASGTAANGGVFVVSGVTEVDGVITAVDSREVEQAGAAAAAEVRLRGASDAAGYVANDTLAALRNELNSMTGGQGSIASQIQTAIEGLDSELAASGTRNSVEAEPDASVFTKVAITDGKLDSAKSTSVLIGGIPVADLATILV